MLLKFIMANFLNMLYLLNLGFADVTRTDDLDYTRLEFLGASCYPKDSCDSDVTLSLENKTCLCDSQCQKYNDCCIDATIALTGTSQNKIEGLKCMTYESDTKGAYAVSKCHKNYNGPAEVRNKCENFEDMSDPLAAAPATDMKLNITYKNRYCAQCNQASPANLKSWGVTIECPDIPDNTSTPLVDSVFVKEHLTYVVSGQYSNNWGFFYRQDNKPSTEEQFYPCNIPFLLPGSINPYVRKCIPYVVSSCAKTWRRKVHHDLCQAYMAIVYIDNQLYRNPDCAYCNNKNLNNFQCIIPKISITGRRKKPALSFTMLLDVNTSDGNIVGEVRDNRCSEDQKWDPFFKKCRTIVCAIPGYRRRNNKCVRS